MKSSFIKYRNLILTFVVVEFLAGLFAYFYLNFSDASVILTFVAFNILAALIFLSVVIAENKKRVISTARVLGIEATEAFGFAKVGLIILDESYNTAWSSESITIDKAIKIGSSVYDWLPEFEEFLDDAALVIKKQISGRTYNIRFLNETRTLLVDDISLLEESLTMCDNDATVIAFIRIDNYQNTIQSAAEETILNISVAVRGGITKWANKFGIFYKSYATDGFIVITNNETFNRAEADKFDFINEIKAECKKFGEEITLSIGVGRGNNSIIRLTEMANDAIERAEARGGDQIVISNYGKDLQYYGGHSEAKTTKSKTKIRQVAKDVVEKIKEFEKILVVGHKYGDYDAVASGLAIASLARSYEKTAKTAIDLPTLDEKARRNMDKHLGSEYMAKNIISPAKAEKYVDKNTLLIVVDTSVPGRIEVPSVLKVVKDVIVLDHHRRGAFHIENASVEYVEPGASSTSEIVTEIIEFNNADQPLNINEINLLFTGIVMDTNNFKSTRVGPRTFIASGVLKGWGADQTIADNLLKDTYEEYQLKSQVISTATKLDEKAIIAIVPKETRVHGSTLAQIAQQILEIEGIKAAFVLGTNNNGDAACSARSNGEVNVQVIMEKVGGGGHFNAAATQTKELSLEDLEVAVVKAYKGQWK